MADVKEEDAAHADQELDELRQVAHGDAEQTQRLRLLLLQPHVHPFVSSSLVSLSDKAFARELKGHVRQLPNMVKTKHCSNS